MNRGNGYVYISASNNNVNDGSDDDTKLLLMLNNEEAPMRASYTIKEGRPHARESVFCFLPVYRSIRDEIANIIYLF